MRNYGTPKSEFVHAANFIFGRAAAGLKSGSTDRVRMLSRMSSLTAHDFDHAAVTEGCGLLDRSERGKLALTGDGAKGFLQGQVSNDVEALTPGTGCYAAFLTPKGKMLGDL